MTQQSPQHQGHLVTGPGHSARGGGGARRGGGPIGGGPLDRGRRRVTVAADRGRWRSRARLPSGSPGRHRAQLPSASPGRTGLSCHPRHRAGAGLGCHPGHRTGDRVDQAGRAQRPARAICLPPVRAFPQLAGPAAAAALALWPPKLRRPLDNQAAAPVPCARGWFPSASFYKLSPLRGGGAGRRAAYLLSASIRRSMRLSTLPVLGRSRPASRSLSSALVRPS